MEAKLTTVARINEVNILVIENGEKRIAIKPICQALGIDFKSQYDKLKMDPILNSTMVLSTIVAMDQKEREMVTIPMKYVFGWLFRIDSRNVNADAREAVLKYQLQCYDALYAYFTRHDEYLEFRDKLISQKLAEYDKVRLEFRTAKDKVQEAREALDEARAITEDDYFANTAQLSLFGKEEA